MRYNQQTQQTPLSAQPISTLSTLPSAGRPIAVTPEPTACGNFGEEAPMRALSATGLIAAVLVHRASVRSGSAAEERHASPSWPSTHEIHECARADVVFWSDVEIDQERGNGDAGLKGQRETSRFGQSSWPRHDPGATEYQYATDARLQ